MHHRSIEAWSLDVQTINATFGKVLRQVISEFHQDDAPFASFHMMLSIFLSLVDAIECRRLEQSGSALKYVKAVEKSLEALALEAKQSLQQKQTSTSNVSNWQRVSTILHPNLRLLHYQTAWKQMGGTRLCKLKHTR